MASDDDQPVPPALEFESHVFDIAFHPSEDIVAAGLITGEVHCYKLNVGDGAENSHLFSSDHHKKSCRALAFSHNGDSLYTASKDKSLQVLDSSTGKLKLRKADAHDDPLNCLLNLNENLLASGDDGGAVKIWDLRQKKKVISWKENQDFISDMSFVAHKKTLVVTSGDGCLSIFDIRKPAPVCVSDNQDDELLSVAIVKNYKKAVVGTQDGVLSIFSWGNWGDCTDRFPGHPSSIDAIVKIDENTICTGSSDGLIRVVGILPNRLIGILGDHGEGMPIERLKLSGSNSWIGSCSHDSVVKFWDVAYLFEGDEDEDEGTAAAEESLQALISQTIRSSSADDQTHDNQSDEDDDDEDDDEDEDDGDDDEDDDVDKDDSDDNDVDIDGDVDIDDDDGNDVALDDNDDGHEDQPATKSAPPKDAVVSISAKAKGSGPLVKKRAPLIINGKDVAKLAAAATAREAEERKKRALPKESGKESGKKTGGINGDDSDDDDGDDDDNDSGDSDDSERKSKKKKRVKCKTMFATENPKRSSFFSALD